MNKYRSCALATRLASDALDRQLSFFESLRLRLHLAMCRSCSNCRHEMKLLHRTLRQLQEMDTVGERSLSKQEREAIRLALHEITAESPKD